MHHRAICLLPVIHNTAVGTPAFSAVLQAAAGRAWVRRAATYPHASRATLITEISSPIQEQSMNTKGRPASKAPTQLPSRSVTLCAVWLATRNYYYETLFRLTYPTPPHETEAVASTCSPSSPTSSTGSTIRNTLRVAGGDYPTRGAIKIPALTTRRNNHGMGIPNTIYFQPDLLQDHDIQPADPSREDSSRYFYMDDPSVMGTPVAPDPPPLANQLSKVVSSDSLYQNLLFLLSFRTPPPSLPALLDYHDLYPEYRSTRSYNMLISLALRHSSFGTVQWLLEDMHANGLPADLETWKLQVRWLVLAGWWDQAWKQAVNLESSNLGPIPTSPTSIRGPSPPENREIPFSVWLEFFRTMKRGAIRRRARSRWTRGEDGILRRTPAVEIVAEATDPQALYSARLHTLMTHCPILRQQEMKRTSPRIIYYVTNLMLQSNQKDAAFRMTRSYLAGLPRTIPQTWTRICLDIIHLLVSLGSTKKGLPRLYESHRMLISFLALHPSLRPTSTTLFLLLSNLQRAKRCGTVAWNIVRGFRSRWGAHTEDRRVRRRVIALALKEGRMDIVSEVSRSERTSRRLQRRWMQEREVVGGSERTHSPRLSRPPGHQLFKRDGREEWLWYLMRKRRSRRLHQRQLD